MKRVRATAWLGCFLTLLPASAGAQSEFKIEPPKGGLGWLTHPYQAREVPPISLTDSPRLDSLIKQKNLYLSAQDVIALAIENNVDIEVQRYGPLLAREVLRRAQGGGLLRSVGLGVAPGPTSVSLSGVSSATGSTVSTSGNGVNSGGGILTQLGPTVPSLDPTLSAYANFQHSTIPQSNTILTGTTALVETLRTYQAAYQQNWDFGLSAQLSYASQYTKVNSTFFSLNPYTSGQLDLQLTQNFLNGFGVAVNGRNIRVQKNNLKVTDLQFKQQVITTISAVLNLYWGLVSFYEDVRAREQEVRTSEQLLEGNKQQVQLGSLAEIEITRAQSQLFTSKQDLVVSQTNLVQQETILKNALTRSGVATSDLADVHIVPLDKIVVPEQDELKPPDELVSEALKNRVEIEQGRINVESNKLNLVGIKNSLKPTLQGFTELTNNGLSGALTEFGALEPGVGYLAGGYGNLLEQIFRRNYPNYSAGFSLNIPLRNRAAQADYTSSLIEIRQNELNLHKQVKQVRVDVQNAIVGLQQARVRYEAARQARILSQQTFDADKKRFDLGAATAYQVVQDQRDLASAVSTEVQAMANYSHARISFDEALGTTLEVNHVSISEAVAGRVSQGPSNAAQRELQKP